MDKDNKIVETYKKYHTSKTLPKQGSSDTFEDGKKVAYFLNANKKYIIEQAEKGNKEAKWIAETKEWIEKKKVEKKATTKKATVKKVVTKKETVKKTTTKKAAPKKENRFILNDEVTANIEKQAEEQNLEEIQTLQNIYNTVFNHFAEERFHEEILEYDATWEESENKEIRNMYAMAKGDGLKFKEVKNLREEPAKEVVEKEEVKPVTLLTPVKNVFNSQELISEVALKLHDNWCLNELKEFYDRAKIAKSNGALGIENILQAACYKKGKKRNEIECGIRDIKDNASQMIGMFESFDEFRKYVGYTDDTIIKVRKYAKRNVEYNLRQDDYKSITGEENILRPFASLSDVSRKEVLDVVNSAYSVYEENGKAGITLEKLESDMNYVLLGMHTKWLEKNKDREDKSMLVPFNEVNDDVKKQYTEAFVALSEVVKTNNGKYFVSQEENAIKPNYQERETNILDEIRNPKVNENMNQDNIFAKWFTRQDELPSKVEERQEAVATEIVNAMAQGEDVLNENSEENKSVNNTYGFTGPWLLGLVTGIISCGLIVLGAFFIG